MSDSANTTAPSDHPRKRVRVRSRHRRSSTYNQLGIGRRDIIVGAILLVVIMLALVWVVYSFYVKNSGMGSDSGVVTVPEDTHESTRF